VSDPFWAITEDAIPTRMTLLSARPVSEGIARIALHDPGHQHSPLHNLFRGDEGGRQAPQPEVRSGPLNNFDRLDRRATGQIVRAPAFS